MNNIYLYWKKFSAVSQLKMKILFKFYLRHTQLDFILLTSFVVQNDNGFKYGIRHVLIML